MQNRIRELRKSKRMSMKELGKIIGTAESTISHYETGRRQPDNETLLKLSKFFGVTVGYLIGAEQNEAQTAICEDGEVMSRLKELRIQHNYLQEDVAKQLNVDRTTYVKYENGQSDPPTSTWIELAEFYNVTIGYLLGIEQKETPPAINEDSQQGTVNRNIIRIAGRDGSIQERYLSDEQLSALKFIVDQLPDASDSI